ncbi:hypothetical protein BT96DRAFT_921930 [Gymnopus androsaceus JB14]|uniref:Uncharacterized protein n=1 Tax=Gymnopus androsaceus JB14 TaxID=1447944 RepID=A0A6A4HG72_9AGAR|nr:hypothetical protein BT96DRAFT_921930 [Gymnopus androsaceus JB14]
MLSIVTARHVRNASTPESHIISPDFVCAILSGDAPLDIEDPLSKSWIRLVMSEGILMCVPGGSLRIYPGDSNSFKCLMLFKNPEVSMAWDKAADSHPARQEYLESLGL